MVIQRLRQEGYTILTGSDVINDSIAPDMIIEGDGHLFPLAYKREAQLVFSFLEYEERA